MNIIKKSIIINFLNWCVCACLFAQAPMLINYQGKLNNNGTPIADGNYDITFRFYNDSTSGILLHSDLQVDVSVKNGVFHAFISVPDTLFSGAGERYLAVKVGVQQEMKPRLRLVSVPYALTAQYAKTLSASDGNPVDAVVVDEDGNVGIGTQTPESKLQVNGVVQAGPVCARWYATNDGAEAPVYYKWGHQIFNSNSQYLSVVNDSSEIEIKIAGYYQVCVNVLQTGLDINGQRGNVYLRRNGYSIAQSLEYSGHSSNAGHTGAKHVMTIIEYFHIGDIIKVFLKGPGIIYGRSSQDWSSLEIYRLN